jgi:hypothetical protein
VMMQLVIAFLLAGLYTGVSVPKEFVDLLSTPHITVAAGKPAVAELKFRVADGFHINSNLPRSSYLIPTKLNLDSSSAVAIGRITYPPGRDIELPFAPQEKLNVYSGEFAIGARLNSGRTATPGDYTIHGELSYQACNDRACYPPKKLPVVIDVTVSPARSGAPASGSFNREVNH